MNLLTARNPRTVLAMGIGSLLAGLLSTALAAQEPSAEKLANNPVLFLETARKTLKWDEPADPAKLVGPIYFVGTQGLGVFLITGSHGHVVLNSGMPGSGPMIEKSIRRLGFKPEDIKLLLVGHAHSDHAGGHAYLQKLSGAKIAVIREEQELFESGGKLDFQYGDYKAYEFEPAKVDVVFKDEDEINLGDIAITALLTNGHTKGSTTFVMQVVDGGQKYTVVFPNGTSINPGYRLVKDPSYRGIANDYRRTFRILDSLKPDIWLYAHNEVYRFKSKLDRSSQEGAKAWVDTDGYRKWVAAQHEKFEAEIAKERGEGR